jgi:uncharacterized protein involved in outer membrane biogenesis
MRNILPRWRWRYLIILAVLALLLAGALQLPELARQRLEQALAGATGGRAQVEQVAFDPFRLAVTVRGVRLDDADGALLVDLQALRVDLAADSLWTRSVHLDALRLVGARGALGLLAEDRLYPRLPGGGDEADQPPPRIRVDRVELVGSALAIRDESAAPSSALRLTDLSLALDGFDSRADTPIAVSLHGRVGAGRLRVEGVLTLASVAFAGTLSATGLAAGPALAYAERALPLHARGGRIDAAAAVHLDDGAVRLSDARIALRGSRITDTADTPLVTVGEVVAEGVDVDLAAQRLVLARLSGSDNWLALGRRADGTLNLAALVDTADADGEAAAPEAGSSPWQIELGELALSDTRIAVTDATLSPPLAQDVTVGQLQVGSLTPGQPTSLALAASLPDGAELAVQGEGQLPAGPARLDISADKLPLPLLARYLPDLGPVMLRSGTLAAQGRLQVDEAGPRFDGQAKLSQLELWDTEREDVPLSLRTLRIDNLAASPERVSASKIWINRPTLRLVITENRQSNLARFGPPARAPAPAAAVTAAEQTPVAAPEGPSPSMQFAVDTVRISRGTFRLEDRSLDPHFAVSVQQLGGDVDGLSSAAKARGRVSLNGRVDEYAPASVTGSFSLTTPLQAQFQVSLRGVEMATFAPYVTKFAGYRIDRGTLNVDLDYTVDGPRIEGENKIVLDRLELGERVDSPEALDLPLTLALAVLRDSAGVIDVDLPVRGDLSNPQFGYGALIGKALRQVIVKAVTAPFTFLARLVGGDSADLRTVAFPPGAATLADVQRGQLQQLAQALIARPQLTLDIRPQVDQADSRALAQQALQQALAQAGVDADDDEEQTERLVALYQARFGSEPPPVPPPEGTQPSAQEQRAAAARAGRERLLAAMAPDADAMQALARARGEAIRAALAGNGVPLQRMAITVPALPQPLPPSAVSEFELASS